MAHAKAVFFVDDQQTQVQKVRVLAQQFVRADHNVHRAIGHTLQRGIDLLGGAKAAHLGNLDRPLGKSVVQRLEMLLRQQGGRGQYGHLFATGDGNEGGAQRHLGLAKAHVAAHQTVHGAGADHVLDHAVDGGLLVGGLFKAKVVGKGLVVVCRVAEGMALARGAAGVDVEQLGG